MKKAVCLLFIFAMLFSLFGCGQLADTPAETQPLSENSGARAGSPTSYDEIQRVLWYGFADEEILQQPDKTVTWQEYCTMIGRMLDTLDAELGAQWQEMAALALNSKETMLREQGCFALYRAIDLMDLEMDDRGVLLSSVNPHLLPSNDGTLPYSWNYTPFTGADNDAWIFEENYETLFGPNTYINAAVMYCQSCLSFCSFKTLYDVPGDITAPLTVQEAALSVLRLYELDENVAKRFWMEKIAALDAEAAEAGEPEDVTILREKILNSPTAIAKSNTYIPGQTYTGKAYYVSPSGDDRNNGLSPETAWATLDRVDKQGFDSGDAVFFERGGIYRGQLFLWEEGSLTLSAYGEGPKPVLTSALECAAGADKWILHQEQDGAKIWKYYKDCLDCGLIVFNDEKAGTKILADWSGTQWVNEDGTPFDVASALTENLDFFSDDGGRFGGAIDFFTDNCTAEDVQYGPLYLRCDEGNPGELYDCIELCTMNTHEKRAGAYNTSIISGVQNKVYDNLSFKYYPMCAFDMASNSLVQNCELAWGGGCVQIMRNGHIGDGRMGDAICRCGDENSTIINNYIHDIASAPLTLEAYSDVVLKNIRVDGNLFERSRGIGISNNEHLAFESVSFSDNIFYLTGASWAGDIRGNSWLPTACFQIMQPYEYTDCIISRNKMYSPLHFFYYSNIAVPNMTDNLYYPSQNTYAFADLCIDHDMGPYNPVSMEDAEKTIRELFGDASSSVQ